MAMPLCMGMLMVCHRKRSQLGEVRIPLLGLHSTTKGQQEAEVLMDGEKSSKGSVHDRFKSQSQGYSCFISLQPCTHPAWSQFTNLSD